MQFLDERQNESRQYILKRSIFGLKDDYPVDSQWNADQDRSCSHSENVLSSQDMNSIAQHANHSLR